MLLMETQALAIFSAMLWAIALACEYHVDIIALHTIKHAFGIPKAPCRILRANPGYNYVFIGLPITMLCLVKMQLANDAGSLGLLVLGETAALLAVNGFVQIESMHIFFICLTWLFAMLAWLNLSLILCLAASGPLLCLGLFVMLYVGLIRDKQYNHDGEDDDAITIAAYWIMELYYILSNLLWLFIPPPKHYYHFNFDIIAAIAVTGIVLPLGFFARWMWPDNILWK